MTHNQWNQKVSGKMEGGGGVKGKGDEDGCQRHGSRFGLHPGDPSGFSF